MKKLITKALIAFLFTAQSCGSSTKAIQSDKTDGFTTTASGLKFKVLKEGAGLPVKTGQEILLHETMSYANDSLLFDSRKQTGPIKVLLGANQVIKGVEEGLAGMKKGEIKKLIVPPSLSKRTGTHTFPHPDSTLIYEIELVDILPE